VTDAGGRASVRGLAFQEVHHLVDQDVFDAIEGFLGEFEVEPDAMVPCVAAAPPGLHLLDAPVGDLHPDDGLPFGDQARQQRFHVLEVPGVQ
jgi:hypothetical protein